MITVALKKISAQIGFQLFLSSNNIVNKICIRVTTMPEHSSYIISSALQRQSDSTPFRSKSAAACPNTGPPPTATIPSLFFNVLSGNRLGR